MEGESPDEFQKARREVRRAQLALNFLVILSAAAGTAFFGYVLYTIRPFGGGKPEPVVIPTSQAGATVASLEGEDGGILVSVHDLDEASAYSAELSERMRKDLAIGEAGRIFRLSVHNTGETEISLKLESLTLTSVDGRQWQARWLPQVAAADKATAVGRMRIAQGATAFALPAGAQRQLNVFIAGDPPGTAKLKSGLLSAGERRIELSHRDTGVAQ
jgi:hypothetical protein